MKYLNKYLLLFLLSFSLIQAAEKKDNAENAEKEYQECIKRADNQLYNEAKYTTIIGNERWRGYQEDRWLTKISGKNKFIYDKYNHQCNKCLAGYVLKSVFTFLKKDK